MTIDDNEAHYAKVLMDEIFGRDNFIASVIWQKVYAPKSSAKYFSDDHDYVLVYAKNAESLDDRTCFLALRSRDKAYKNPDNDPRGPWTSGDLLCSQPIQPRDVPDHDTRRAGSIDRPAEGKVLGRVRGETRRAGCRRAHLVGQKRKSNVPALKTVPLRGEAGDGAADDRGLTSRQGTTRRQREN